MKTPGIASFEYASLLDRILAYVLDMVIRLIYLATVVLIAILVGPLIDNSEAIDNSAVVWVPISFLGVLPILFYSALFEYFTNGQTPGKRPLNIRVVSVSGEATLSFKQCFLRCAAGLIEFGLLYGIPAVLLISLSSQKQRLGDNIAGTIILKE